MMTEREGRWVSRKGGKSLKRKHWGISRYVGYIENKGEREGERKRGEDVREREENSPGFWSTQDRRKLDEQRMGKGNDDRRD